jgi:hypothetical protein
MFSYTGATHSCHGVFRAFQRPVLVGFFVWGWQWGQGVCRPAHRARSSYAPRDPAGRTSTRFRPPSSCASMSPVPRACRPAVRARLMRLAGRRLTKDGVLVIRAVRFRTQGQNREDARDRLAELVQRATFVPRPRIATRPTRPRRSAASRRRSGGARPSAGEEPSRRLSNRVARRTGGEIRWAPIVGLLFLQFRPCW